jgi:flagellar biosynthesis GTPase FlhF
MSSVLPVIEMPKKEPAPEPMPSVTPENKLPEQAGNMELIDQLMDEKRDDSSDDDIIKVDERVIPEEDEVFSDPPASRAKIAPAASLAVLEEDLPQVPPNEFTQKKGKRKYVRKAPMSDKQKEHLAKIRKIAQDKRKLEKERKAKEKEDKLVEKAEKKILEKKEKEKKEEVKPKEQSKPSVIQQNGFTKDDLDNAVLSAISQYDTLRKQRKKEKVERESKQREEDKMRATLARAIQPQQNTAPDPWRSLFG